MGRWYLNTATSPHVQPFTRCARTHQFRVTMMTLRVSLGSAGIPNEEQLVPFSSMAPATCGQRAITARDVSVVTVPIGETAVVTAAVPRPLVFDTATDRIVQHTRTTQWTTYGVKMAAPQGRSWNVATAFPDRHVRCRCRPETPYTQLVWLNIRGSHQTRSSVCLPACLTLVCVSLRRAYLDAHSKTAGQRRRLSGSLSCSRPGQMPTAAVVTATPQSDSDTPGARLTPRPNPALLPYR